MDEIAGRRRAKAERDRFGDVSEWLRQLYVDYRSGELEGALRSVVVVMIGDDASQVVWAGAPSKKELLEAAEAIKTATLAELQGQDPFDAVQEMIRRKRSIEAQMQARIDEFYRDHPFECRRTGCTRRFKTARGRDIHERTHGEMSDPDA